MIHRVSHPVFVMNIVHTLQQRQMNYFGFRKIAGKGKMAPCSYVNEHANEDISSLLFIKRKKTGISSAAAKLMAQQNRINRSMGLGDMGISGSALGMIGYNHGGMGGATGLPGAGATLSLNNFSMGGGGSSHGRQWEPGFHVRFSQRSGKSST